MQGCIQVEEDNYIITRLDSKMNTILLICMVVMVDIASSAVLPISFAFPNIHVDGQGNVDVKLAKRPTARGKVGQFVQTGSVDFPGDRKYSFWYYPSEATIYWGKDRGTLKWRGRKTGPMTHIIRAFPTINMDAKGNLTIDNRQPPTANRPPGKGQINRLVQRGWVRFSGDRMYNLWYYPGEATIYWSRDKGKTTSIWRAFTPITVAFPTIKITGQGDVRVDMGTGPPGTGKITRGFVQTGSVTFGDKTYSLFYHPSEATIYWGRDKGGYKWKGTPHPGFLTRISHAFKTIKVYANRTVTIDMRSGVDGKGYISALSGTGFVNYKKKRYNFWYYPREAKIYWGDVKGKSTNIWKGTALPKLQHDESNDEMSKSYDDNAGPMLPAFKNDDTGPMLPAFRNDESSGESQEEDDELYFLFHGINRK